MEEHSGTKREIDLGEEFDVVVKVNGVRIEVSADGSIQAYTNNAVDAFAPANDEALGAVPEEPKPGNKMKDGTIYAGVSPDTGEALYVMPQDAPLKMKWDEAMKYAANLDAHGHRDWKLPSKSELTVLFSNHAKIGGFDTSGLFPAGYYWSSTEFNNFNAWGHRLSDGDQNFFNKNPALSVRCVRRN